MKYSYFARLCCFHDRQDKTNTTDINNPLQSEIHSELCCECAICLKQLDKGQVIYMKGCQCVFHYECIGKYVKSLLDKKKKELYCPLCQSLQIQIFNNFKYAFDQQRTQESIKRSFWI